MELSLLSAVSLLATISTVGLFLCGVPICRKIIDAQTTDGISALPFSTAVVGCFFWTRYGFLKSDNTLITVNSIGFALELCYILIFWWYSQVKATANKHILVCSLLCGSMLLYVETLISWGRPPEILIEHLGLACTVGSICIFGSPLSQLKEVVVSKSTATLPLPLCIANFTVSTLWVVYGVLIADYFVQLPNALGAILGLIQLALFVVYPNAPAPKVVSLGSNSKLTV